ncbi:MAG: TRAP transporter small permease subunit [Betaproteobacteria bacterium]|jgi:TRAP-type mannitol/chloroaromatic compound transport system permease small subunit|nr:TRAP transporter small permease subunit [Betaproteobacteria bacterium]NBT66476.1 TRAP transporter small permease subunit [Betaproteobacteria bacterium]NBY07564.1 TRAP transporter small permease subunit [Betaproteobacteria bacterium]
MKPLFKLAELIDAINNKLGVFAMWAILISCFISCANAVIRFVFNNSSNGWLEIQWYLFAAAVMLGAGMVLRVNEHVRVDVIYGQLSTRAKVYIDLMGLVFFLLPVMVLMMYLSYPLFIDKFYSGEVSSNAGGLIRWPVWLMLPLGYLMILLQGISEIIKRVGWLTNQYEMNLVYERPLQ